MGVMGKYRQKLITAFDSIDVGSPIKKGYYYYITYLSSLNVLISTPVKFCFTGSHFSTLLVPCKTRLLSMKSRNLKSHWAEEFDQNPTRLAKMFTAYLDNIAILDDCSQQLSVFGFILFLFQICRMLKLKKNNSIAGCFVKKNGQRPKVKSISKNWRNSEHVKHCDLLLSTT